MAGTRHTQSLVESRTFEKSTVSLWRHEPLQGPRASPALAVAQRTFARSRLAARGLDPNALLPDSDEADEKRSSMVDRAVEALIPHHSLRPPQRIAMPPPRRYASGHGADVAVSRVAIAHQAAAARMRDFGPPDVSSASTRRAAHSAETAAMAKAAAAARAKQEALRARRAAPDTHDVIAAWAGTGAAGSSDGENGGGGGGGDSVEASEAPRVTLAEAEALMFDPGTERLFTEPKFRPPPRVLSAAERSAELRRKLGEEGSIPRLLADGKLTEVGVGGVAGFAEGALRKLGALRNLPTAVIERLVRTARLQRRARYHLFYHEGAAPDALFVLVSGTVRLSAGRDQRGGRELKPPAVFGLEALAALGEEPRAPHADGESDARGEGGRPRRRRRQRRAAFGGRDGSAPERLRRHPHPQAALRHLRARHAVAQLPLPRTAAAAAAHRTATPAA